VAVPSPAVEPDLELVAAALGARPLALEPIGGGGYTQSATWRAETPGGASFVKQAEEAGSLAMLRREALVYSSVSGSFLPAYVGFADSGERAMLAIEFLDNVVWPPPYPADVTPLFSAIEALADAVPPAGLPTQQQPISRWKRVAADPAPFLSLGLCSRAWLERALPALLAAEREAVYEGEHLVHNDIYSGNVAFTARGAVLVDWGAAVKGSRWIDTAFAVLSVRVEGAVLPAVELPGEGDFAASLAGHFAVEALTPLPAWARPDSTLREDMAGDLAHALRWAAETLELPTLR
jgi:aminoglycoside phosphotransferase (APT) family kinase protein